MHYGVTIFGNNRMARALIGFLIENDRKPDLLVTLDVGVRERVPIAGADASLADWARSRAIEVYECPGYRLVSEQDRAFFSNNHFEIAICTDWQHLIPAHVLDAFPRGVFGFHGSLMALPNGRGRSPLNWSIRLGGTSILHNCFRYSERADEGGVFNTTEIAIGPEDPISVLQFKAMIDYKITTRRLLEMYGAGHIPLVPQPAGVSIWLPKLSPADSNLQFQSINLKQMLDIIRASSHPFAGAFAVTEDGRHVTFWRATSYDGPIDAEWQHAPIGGVLAAAMGAILVKCRDGLLLVTELSVDVEELSAVQFQ